MNVSFNSNTVVSFDSESLILVDEHDQEIGHQDKLTCHQGDGLLHRAFSLFIFNEEGELLLQQRSKQKKLWPLYWSNSCCSHPRQGEALELAIERRLQQELGFTTSLTYLYKFKYQASYLDIGAEHELCSVFIGQSSAPIKINTNEIAGCRFISARDLDREIKHDSHHITPWFKLEWQTLTEEHRDTLKDLCVRLPG